MQTWTIHYADREYAREMGDPVLGRVEADTKEAAEQLARDLGLWGTGMGGVWAVPGASYAEPGQRTVDMVVALSSSKEPEDVVLQVVKKREFRPVPGKFAFDTTINAPAKIAGYGKDASGEYVEVQRAGSYRAKVRIPLSCIRPLTDEERQEVSENVEQGFW